ncbi:MAG: hypothetical protein EBR28_03295 [Planctomycetia bacterium]|nr:hypothetical protein [Planctomycetia bacterium]
MILREKQPYVDEVGVELHHHRHAARRQRRKPHGPAEFERDRLVERGLRLKAIGCRILEVLGGRAVHPINVTVGGFYSWR